jgi:hypothetical protein
MNHEINSHVILAVFGNEDPRKSLNDGDDCDILSGDENPANLVAQAFEKARLNSALGKSPLDGFGWDEELGDAAPAPKATNNFVKSSDERFKKTAARIRELFGPEHMELAEEAIALAEKVRGEAIAEVIASV